MADTRAVRQRVETAAEAARALARADEATRRAGLEAIAAALEANRATIEAANRSDVERSERDGLAAPLLKRLRFGGAKIDSAIAGVRSVAALPESLGRVLERRELDEGLTLERIASPIGVIAMVFESRPDALVQIASLALKSGNAVVLKGGSEAAGSNRALARLIADATGAAGVPDGWIQLVETRAEVAALLALDDLIDLVIPRGSNEFVRQVMDSTRIPVLGHADGICHLYLDRSADIDRAVRIAVDGKTQYVAVCNAVEHLLVDVEAAPRLLPPVVAALRERGVELRGDERSRAIVADLAAAAADEWGNEYLDLIISVRVVDGVDHAVSEINRWGSHHTDAIVAEDRATAERFLQAVDSASVMWNASTRFADGYRYGLGAEVGIATGRIHARGPVGVDGLLSHRWIVRGSGHIVADYASGARSFTHRELPLDD